MIAATSVDASENLRLSYVLPNGGQTWISHCIGKYAEMRAQGDKAPPPSEMTPIGFLVDVEPHTSIPGHYHHVDQFQLFIAGEAKFGAKALTGVVLHYAAAHTPYAPISTGDDKLSYLTLRNGFDSQPPQWMPDSKNKLAHLPRAFRAEHAKVHAGDPGEFVVIEQEDIIGFEENGLGARVYRVPAGQSITGPGPSGSRGQFWFVLAGACSWQGAPAPLHSLCFVDPADHPLQVTAAECGAALVVVQFAKR